MMMMSSAIEVGGIFLASVLQAKPVWLSEGVLWLQFGMRSMS